MVNKQDIINEDLSQDYLISQAKGLLMEFEKLKSSGLADNSYIIEKINHIITFLGYIGVSVQTLKESIRLNEESVKQHKAREEYLKNGK